MRKLSKPKYIELHKAIKAGILESLRRKGVDTVGTLEEAEIYNNLVSSHLVEDEDIELALSELASEGFIEVWHSEAHNLIDDYLMEGKSSFAYELSGIDNASHMHISRNASDAMDIIYADKSSYFARYRKLSDDNIVQNIEEIAEQFQTLSPIKYTEEQEASPLSGNSKLRDDLVYKLDNLLLLIESSNSAKATGGQELDEALTNIRASREDISKGKIYIGKIESLLYGSLAYIASSFVDAPIGEAAEVAWDMAKQFIQSAI